MSIAYQVTGDGPLDLVFPPALSVPIDLLWEEPSFVRFAKRLRGFSRTVWCDTRGIGASGGNYLDGLVEEIVDADLTVVLDAAGCERVVLVGWYQAGPTVIRYAATHPERVTALVLINAFAHYVREDDYPWGLSPDALDRYTAPLSETFGTGAALEVVAPSKTSDEGFRAWWARCERLGIGVDQVAVSVRTSFLRDVRALLATLAVPTSLPTDRSATSDTQTAAPCSVFSLASASGALVAVAIAVQEPWLLGHRALSRDYGAASSPSQASQDIDRRRTVPDRRVGDAYRTSGKTDVA